MKGIISLILILTLIMGIYGVSLSSKLEGKTESGSMVSSLLQTREEGDDTDEEPQSVEDIIAFIEAEMVLSESISNEEEITFLLPDEIISNEELIALGYDPEGKEIQTIQNILYL